MFDAPIFQDNILTNLLNFNLVWLTSRLWLPWMMLVALVLGSLALMLRRQLRTAPEYFNLFSNISYKFDRKSKSDRAALVFFVGAIGLTALYMFSNENSFFETYDHMAIGTMRTLDIGLVVNFDTYRITPLAFWNLSTLYAITQNVYMLKAFVLAQLLLALYLMYCFFDYIPTARRLAMFAILLLTPTFLLTSKIIFPDREILIAVFASLLCVRRYSRYSQLRWALAYLFFVNVAIYTKETCILFYAGILATSILYAVWNEKIVTTDFLHPIKLIKSMPLEFLTGMSLFLYSVIYFFISATNETNAYLLNGQQSLHYLLVNYRLELAVLAAAVLLLAVRAKRNYDTAINPMFRGGLVIGALAIAATIVFVLHTAPNSPHLRGKSYYLLLTLLFATAYLFEHIRKRRVMIIFGAAMLFYSTIADWDARLQEIGKYHRQTAEFFAQKLNKDDVSNIFIIDSPQATKDIDKWVVEAWSTAYRYYFKQHKIIIKSNKHSISSFRDILSFKRFAIKIYVPITPAKEPTAGDWVVVSKMNNLPETKAILKMLPSEPEYENDMMAVYKM